MAFMYGSSGLYRDALLSSMSTSETTSLFLICLCFICLRLLPLMKHFTRWRRKINHLEKCIFHGILMLGSPSNRILNAARRKRKKTISLSRLSFLTASPRGSWMCLKPTTLYCRTQETFMDSSMVPFSPYMKNRFA